MAWEHYEFQDYKIIPYHIRISEPTVRKNAFFKNKYQGLFDYDDYIIDLHLDGLNPLEIAKKLSCSYTKVRFHIRLYQNSINS